MAANVTAEGACTEAADGTLQVKHNHTIITETGQ